MSYELLLTIILATGLPALGFLLLFFSGLRWRMGWAHGDLGEIITDAAYIGLFLWLAFIGMVLLRALTGIPADPRPWNVLIAVGFWLMCWSLLIRYVYWRFYTDRGKHDGTDRD